MRVLSGSIGLDGPERCGRPVSDDPARLAGVVTAGLVLRTLADHQAFTLRAFCQACNRSVALDHQALADRYRWDVPLGDIRLRLRCHQCGRRADRLMKASCRDRECVGV